MLELLLCSMLTIVPDYLFRRYGQGKRFGHEITLFSVWFELRWGIVTCLMLTDRTDHDGVLFPSGHHVRHVLLPDGSHRPRDVRARCRDLRQAKFGNRKRRTDLQAGRFKQKAAIETIRRRIIEIDAQMLLARSELAGAEGQLVQAQGAYQQAVDELETKQELNRRGADIVARREIEKLQLAVKTRQGGVDAARSAKQGIETRISDVLPAQKASTEATLVEAEVELAKTVVRAGVTAVSNNSRCRSATSSIRWRAQPEC